MLRSSVFFMSLRPLVYKYLPDNVKEKTEAEFQDYPGTDDLSGEENH